MYEPCIAIPPPNIKLPTCKENFFIEGKAVKFQSIQFTCCPILFANCKVCIREWKLHIIGKPIKPFMILIRVFIRALFYEVKGETEIAQSPNRFDFSTSWVFKISSHLDVFFLYLLKKKKKNMKYCRLQNINHGFNYVVQIHDKYLW